MDMASQGRAARAVMAATPEAVTATLVMPAMAGKVEGATPATTAEEVGVATAGVPGAKFARTRAMKPTTAASAMIRITPPAPPTRPPPTPSTFLGCWIPGLRIA